MINLLSLLQFHRLDQGDADPASVDFFSFDILQAAVAKMAFYVLVAMAPRATQHDAFQLILFFILYFHRPLLL